MFLRRFALLNLTFISLTLLAQTKTKSVDPSRLMSITYGSASWNTDSAKIDSAYLVMRDKDTGKIVQIQLEETEPDSSKFVGQFSVNMGPNEKISPEIFIPPSELRRTDKDNKKLYDAIKSNKLVRKPVIWKKSEKGQAMIDVYDTREQAEAALAAYQDEQKLKQPPKTTIQPSTTSNQAALAAAAKAERQLELEKLALQAAKRESDRVRMEQIERQKAEERNKAAREASAKEKAERKAKAAEIYAKANVHYEKNEYAEAEALFKQAVDLDPENASYYYRYGVTLYRLNKYNEALVVMKLAQVDQKTELEKSYYMGLIYYRLAELDAALREFSRVGSSSDPLLGPASTFYVGVINFTQEKYEPSKAAFEKVIDTSKEPKLDEQAEEYLERIANAIAFRKLREKKFTVTGIVGAMYDSNVLLAPDVPADQGVSTKISDARLLTIGDLEYRPIYSEHHEWTPHLNASLTNSLKNTAAPADPYLYNLNLPYSYKGVLWSKGFKLTVKPAYETLIMAPSSSASTKENILSSMYMSVDATFVMSQKYFASYGLEYRIDDSKVSSSIGVNDADANKYTVRTTHSFLLDKSRKQILSANLGYVINNAKGADKKYKRMEGGVIFVKPIKWDASWSLGLNLYSLKYDGPSAERTDLNSMFSTGISKPIRDWFTWGVIGSYTKNNSTDTSTYEYSKFLIMTTATFNTNF